MKKLALIVALLMSLSCLLIACDSGNTHETTPNTTVTDAPTQPVDPPTEAPTQAPSGKITYTVTVKDQNGNPVEGAAVQMCDDSGCKMPAATGADGTVTFTYAPSNYHITIVECPDGYTCDPEQSFYFEGESTELTVEITKN